MPHLHSLIARPKGLPGYAPSEWCAVCGKTTANTRTVRCATSSCPNLCHNLCLSDTTQQDFTCEDVGALRTQLGIQDVVTYVTSTQDPAAPSIPPSNTDEVDDLHQLEKSELLTIIEKLRRENKKYKRILHQFDTTVKNISEIRDSQVTVLNFIDYIIATQTSLNNLTVTSTATSARGHTIDKDWRKHTAHHTESRDWWTSGKPRQLQRGSTDISSTFTQTDTDISSTFTHTDISSTFTQTDTPTTPSPTIAPAPVLSPPRDSVSQVNTTQNLVSNPPPLPTAPEPRTTDSTTRTNHSTNPAQTSLRNHHPSTPPPDSPAHNTISQEPINTPDAIRVHHSTNPSQTAQHNPHPSASARNHSQKSRKDNRAHPPSQNTKKSDSRQISSPLHQRNSQQKHNINSQSTETRPHPPPLLSLSIPHRTTNTPYCNYCKRTGHTDKNCYWRNWCDHCNREGHTIDSCRSFRAQERHEKLCHQLTEQTAITTSLVDLLTKHLSQTPPTGTHQIQHQPPHHFQPPYTARNYGHQPDFGRQADPYLR